MLIEVTAVGTAIAANFRSLAAGQRGPTAKKSNLWHMATKCTSQPSAARSRANIRAIIRSPYDRPRRHSRTAPYRIGADFGCGRFAVNRCCTPIIRICRDEGTTRRRRKPELGVLCAVPNPAVAAVDRVGVRRVAPLLLWLTAGSFLARDVGVRAGSGGDVAKVGGHAMTGRGQMSLSDRASVFEALSVRLSPGYWLSRRIRSAFTCATRARSAGANGAVRMN
jgi:hypothetical protein